MKILAIPGSIRQPSSAQQLLDEVVKFMPPGVDVNCFTGLSGIPAFDGTEPVPDAVCDFITLVQNADGVIIVTPEYAFGIPGALKNALDWTVSSGDFYNKPTALITASSQGEKGHAAMLLVLSALGAGIDSETSLLIPFIRTRFNAEGLLTDAPIIDEIKRLLEAFFFNIKISGN